MECYGIEKFGLIFFICDRELGERGVTLPRNKSDGFSFVVFVSF